MATTKKPTTKKAPAKKPPVKNASVSKKTPAKAVAKSTRKKTTSKPAVAQVRSFHLAKNNPSFTTFRITRQTLYWVILISFIIFAQLWILKLQVEVSTLLELQQAEILNNKY